MWRSNVEDGNTWGHVLRMQDESIVKRLVKWVPPGKIVVWLFIAAKAIFQLCGCNHYW
jgi:hypothetical protein